MLAGASFAQVLPEPDSASVENRFRVGIDCMPVSEPLQVHLTLDEGTGLIISSIMDGSPADKVGLKRLDVIIEANERPVGTVLDLVRAINEAGETEMSFSIIRRGEEVKMNVTPEQRDEKEIGQIRRNFRDRLRDPSWGGFGRLPPEIQRQLERFGPLEGSIWPDDNEFGGGVGWRRILPGIMMGMDKFPRRPLPNGFNFNMQVERTGDGLAKIKVQQGDKAWDVDENNLDDLPDDIRRMVENMLNGSGGAWSGLMAPSQRPARPQPPGPDRDETQLKKRFDGLELQLQDLQNAIRSLNEDK